ncbi:MAG TPA: GNAT family N-acetyltransferase [Lachnospiraceae bacterium]|nr:GNAT family N-acetyltransferase [Lachnospiraceae bacterium]
MICHPTMEQAEELKKIWVTAFPHDEAYVELFFTHYFAPECSIIFRNDSEIESAFHYLTAYLEIEGEPRPFLYLYAGATLPQYGRKGNITAMLNFLYEEAKGMGYYGVSVNSLQTSKNIFMRQNVYPNVFMSELTYEIAETGLTEGLTVSHCDYEQFAVLRHRYVDECPGCIYWKEKELKYMYYDINDSGETLLIETYDGGLPKEYYAVVTKREDSLLIRETDYPKADCLRLVQTIAAHFSFSGTVRLLAREDEKTSINGVMEISRCYLASVSTFNGEKLPEHLYFNLLAIS